jgi:hypothetical protein
MAAPRNPLKHAAAMRGDMVYDPQKPCYRGHSSPRYVRGGACVECVRENTIENRKARPRANKKGQPSASK